MKNRIPVLIALAVTVIGTIFLDAKHPVVWTALGITVLAQLWIIIKDKTNRGVRLGVYAIWIGLTVILVGLALEQILPSGPQGFGASFGAIIFSTMIAFVLLVVSAISFIVGALLPGGPRVPSPAVSIKFSFTKNRVKVVAVLLCVLLAFIFGNVFSYVREGLFVVFLALAYIIYRDKNNRAILLGHWSLVLSIVLGVILLIINMIFDTSGYFFGSFILGNIAGIGAIILFVISCILYVVGAFVPAKPTATSPIP